MQNDIEILQLFPTSLCSINLPEMVSDFWEKQVQNENFYTEGDNPHWQTERTILENNLEMKEFFLVVVKDCLDQLGYVDQKFKITTSWLTATESKTSPLYHNHMNSWYSCVYYFQDSCSDIIFKNWNKRDILVIPTKVSVFNMYEWNISPQKNQFIMFPSNLYHKISENTSNVTRHSLAFNIMPSGKVGHADSTMDYGE